MNLGFMHLQSDMLINTTQPKLAISTNSSQHWSFLFQLGLMPQGALLSPDDASTLCCLSTPDL